MVRGRPLAAVHVIIMAAAQFIAAAAFAQDTTSQKIDGGDNIAVQGVRDSIITIIQGIDLAALAVLLLLNALITLVIILHYSGFI